MTGQRLTIQNRISLQCKKFLIILQTFNYSETKAEYTYSLEVETYQTGSTTI